MKDDMVLSPPNLDDRTSKDILSELRELAPFYVPELDVEHSDGPAFSLLQNFAGLIADVIQHLNRVPHRNFAEFLRRLDIRLQPATPARVPLTFQLASGTPEDVLVPSATQAATEATDTNPEITFETEHNLLATIASLQAVYSVLPSNDSIFEHPVDVQASQDSELFEGVDLQEHSLYIAHAGLFNLTKNATVKITLQPVSTSLAAADFLQGFVWQYWNGEAWVSFESVQVNPARITFTLEKPLKDEQIAISTINNVENRWIRWTFSGGLLKNSRIRNLPVRSVDIQVMSDAIDPDDLFFNDVPLPLPTIVSPVYPLGAIPRVSDSFYIASSDAFSKQGARITLSLGADFPTFDIAVDVIKGIGPKLKQRLNSQGIRNVTQFKETSTEQLAAILRTSVSRASSLQAAAMSVSITQPEQVLSWEYWNGEGWTVLRKISDDTNNLTQSGKILFDRPDDLAVTAVNGFENYWIRVRLIAGDYGKERFTFNGRTVVPDADGVKPPVLRSIKISYETPAGSITGRPEGCVTLDNLDYRDRTAELQNLLSLFRIFIPAEEDKPTIYLGFGKAFLSGPVGIFFSLLKQNYTDEAKPLFQWQYWNGKWTLLDTLDETENLTRSGLLQLAGSEDFLSNTKFNRNLFWIRAVDLENRFQYLGLAPLAPANFSASLSILNRKGLPRMLPRTWVRRMIISGIVRPAPSKEETIGPCPELLEVFHPRFNEDAKMKPFPPAPVVRGIYLNTTWAVQGESIRDEIAGSSNGLGNQTYRLSRSPVSSEEIWVNEFSSLTEEQQKSFKPDKIRIVRDEKNRINQLWVRWNAVEDFLDSTAENRDYRIDRVFGILEFGDGNYGKIPPIGVDNIVATYRFGGGAAGNVGALKIVSLKTSVAGVDQVINYEPAGGGAESETLAQALLRASQAIKHRNRAMAREDFEWIARKASNAVARVRCLPVTNSRGEFETGWVVLLIVPESDEPQPLPSSELIQIVRQYVSDRCPNVVSSVDQLVVTGPAYVEVSIQADIYTTRLDLFSQVQSDVFKTLTRFLHPLRGGPDQQGWGFGKLVCLSDIIALLESLPLVDHVDHVSIRLREPLTSDSTTVTGDHQGLPPYAMIFSGEHEIRMKLQK